ncbi:hypothetical protein QTP86_030092 [Hemibagrus guttatus]|nr:hypothetical protein QTP86_030092 [Hemibagrus guttatus]
MTFCESQCRVLPVQKSDSDCYFKLRLCGNTLAPSPFILLKKTVNSVKTSFTLLNLHFLFDAFTEVSEVIYLSSWGVLYVLNSVRLSFCPKSN